MPTAEVLADGKWSVSAYRRGTNWIQGYTNVADFAGTFAYGIKDRVEIFGSLLVDTRIDRDIRPIFVANPAFDVTPGRLLTGLITERGVCAASNAGLEGLFPERAHG